MDSNLTSSRWAPAAARNGRASQTVRQLPTTRPLTALERKYVNRKSSVERYFRLFRRLRHKSHFLVFSHHQALAQATAVHVGQLLTWSMAPGEAETMFRVDFFEWYVLMERCLLEALAAVEIPVSATYNPSTSKSSNAEAMATTTTTPPSPPQVQSQQSFVTRTNNILGDSKVFKEGISHRFHANVLSALDQKDDNPLHQVLGTGKVRQYLSIAKEFRNRWKEVESMPVGLLENEEELRSVLAKYEKIMKDLKLEELLSSVLQALESAGQIVEYEVATLGRQLQNAGWDVAGLLGTSSNEDVDSPMEASVDAMELG